MRLLRSQAPDGGVTLPMNFIRFAIIFLCLVSIPSRVMAQSSDQQTPKKSTTAQQSNLTPQEKEAQKHYRVAVEALKNNDLETALRELNAASGLAPKNAMIWYNLAVVESKNGDSAPALEHLKKAETLKLPKNLQNDADEMEAKLTYTLDKDRQKQVEQQKAEMFSQRLSDITKSIGLANFKCDYGDAKNAGQSGTENGSTSFHFRDSTIIIRSEFYVYNNSIVIPGRDFRFETLVSKHTYESNLEDLLSVTVLPGVGHCGLYEVFIKTKPGKYLKDEWATATSQQDTIQRQTQPTVVNGDVNKVISNNAPYTEHIWYSNSDTANATAQALSQAIQFSQRNR